MNKLDSSPKQIPIVINNLNRLSSTKKLVEDLQLRGLTNVHIIDNGSTYLPLLEWYDSLVDVKVHRNTNLGQLAIYNSGLIKQFQQEGEKWVAYTDSDIELNPRTPFNFLERLIELAETYKLHKAGLALQIDDLPDNMFSKIFQEWEKKFWDLQLETNVYKADLDTTFCVIKTDAPFTYEALRVGGEFTARHIPWYTDFGNLSEEEKFYLDHVDIEYSGYKRYFNLYLNSIK